MKLPFLGICSALMLSACTGVDGTSSRNINQSFNSGMDTEIFATAGIQIGHLYFSGVGKHAAFVRGDGTVFNRLCYSDFAKFNALENLDQYLIEVPGEFSGTYFSSAGAGVNMDTGALLQVSKLTIDGEANRSGTYKVESLNKVLFNDEGIQLVRNTIGNGCKTEIRNLIRDGREVIIVTAGNVADTVSNVVESSANADIGSGFGSIPSFSTTPSFETTSTEHWSLVYFSITSEMFEF